MLGKEGDRGDEREAEEERETIRKRDPRHRREQERLGHEMTRLLFRSWCSHCIREEDCRRTTAEERNVSELHVGNMFMGDE